MRRFWPAAVVAVLAAAGLALALFERPGDRSLALDAFLLLLGLLALALVLRETAQTDGLLLGPSPLDLALRKPQPVEEQVPELERLERIVLMARQTVFDLHYLLRPMLREVARHRLAGRGVDLDAGDGAAERLLGADAWEIVRPDRPRPDQHFESGVPLDSLERAVTALEEV